MHCVADSDVLEKVCGKGLHTLAPLAARNISYVQLLGDTQSVVLNRCESDNFTPTGQTLEVFADQNMCELEGGCCDDSVRWNDRVCVIEIK